MKSSIKTVGGIYNTNRMLCDYLNKLYIPQIRNITSSYANHKLTANKAKNKLDKLDLSGLNDFGGSYQNVIADINANVTLDKIGDIPTKDSIPTDTTNNLVKENINKYEKIKYSPKKKG